MAGHVGAFGEIPAPDFSGKRRFNSTIPFKDLRWNKERDTPCDRFLDLRLHDAREPVEYAHFPAVAF